MRKTLVILPLMALYLHCQSPSISLDEYVGGWSGEMSNTDAFSFDLILQQNQTGEFSIAVQGENTQRRAPMIYDAESGVHKAQIWESLYFSVQGDENPVCFLRSGHHLSHIDLEPAGSGIWRGHWNLLLANAIDPTFYLSFDSLDDGRFGAFGFFQSPQPHYLNCGEFSSNGNRIRFQDANSGLVFSGRLSDPEKIELEMTFLDETVPIPLHRADYEKWKIGHAKVSRKSYVGEEGNEIATDDPENVGIDRSVLLELSTDIVNQKLEATHSVLIARRDRLVFEEYYSGFDRNTPHDTRSAGKSFASLAVGMALDQQLLPDLDEPIMHYFEEYRDTLNWDPRKDSITIRHLLTMSSGLDADDSRRDSYAAEGNYQSAEDWTQHILEAPMVHSPGAMACYGSANAHLLGPILDQITDQPIEFYLHDELFGPIGIKNYRIQTDHAGRPYFGGGWYVRPIDLVKFGSLYLNLGRWQGQRLFSSTWVAASHARQQVFSTRDGAEYGYLWWKRTYDKGDRKVESYEARGAGGQYVFVVPAYDLVAVVTSGNYRNGKTQQPERIMEEYILRAVE